MRMPEALPNLMPSVPAGVVAVVEAVTVKLLVAVLAIIVNAREPFESWFGLMVTYCSNESFDCKRTSGIVPPLIRLNCSSVKRTVTLKLTPAVEA